MRSFTPLAYTFIFCSIPIIFGPVLTELNTVFPLMVAWKWRARGAVGKCSYQKWGAGATRNLSTATRSEGGPFLTCQGWATLKWKCDNVEFPILLEVTTVKCYSFRSDRVSVHHLPTAVLTIRLNSEDALLFAGMTLSLSWLLEAPVKCNQ